MKEKFPGHFRYNSDEINSIMNEGLLVFDANILLNMYRYSDGTRKDFMGTLRSLCERIWVPFRAVEEFFDNRLDVIGHQIASYDNAIRAVENLAEELQLENRHPFVSHSTLMKTKNAHEDLIEELKNNRERYFGYINDDPILEELSEIFKGRVGEPFDEEKLSGMIKDGELRFKEKVPPGFRDVDKRKGGDDRKSVLRVYGDLFVWFQLIEKSEESGMDVVFVTDDKKDDWWQLSKGRVVGIRPELKAEFIERTSRRILMYQSLQFIEHVGSLTNGKSVNQSSVEEIRENLKVSERDRISVDSDFETFGSDPLVALEDFLEERKIRDGVRLNLQKKLNHALEKLKSLNPAVDPIEWGCLVSEVQDTKRMIKELDSKILAFDRLVSNGELLK